MVARGGIEPPTRGFSVQALKSPESRLRELCVNGRLEVFRERRASADHIISDAAAVRQGKR